MVEIIFASFHRRAEVPETEEGEGEAVAYHVVLAKDPGNGPARFAVRDIHENFFRGVAAIGRADLRIKPAGACADCSAHQKSQEAEPSHRRLFLLARSRVQAATIAFKVLAQEDGGGHVVKGPLLSTM